MLPAGRGARAGAWHDYAGAVGTGRLAGLGVSRAGKFVVRDSCHRVGRGQSCVA